MVREIIDHLMEEYNFRRGTISNNYGFITKSSKVLRTEFSYFKAEYVDLDWLSNNEIKVAPKGISATKQFKFLSNNVNKLWYGKRFESFVDLHDPDSIDEIIKYILDDS